MNEEVLEQVAAPPWLGIDLCHLDDGSGNDHSLCGFSASEGFPSNCNEFFYDDKAICPCGYPMCPICVQRASLAGALRGER